MKFRLLLAAFCTVLCLAAGAASAEAAPIRAVAGTSLIGDIMKDLTDGGCEVLTVVQPTTCPGHDTSKTTDFVFAAKADVMMIHGFQKNMPLVRGLQDVLPKDKAVFVVSQAHGSWLVPDNQLRAVDEIAGVLARIDPAQAEGIRRRAEARKALVRSTGSDILSMLAPVKGKRVAVSKMQEEFVRWAGFDVRATFGRSGDMGAAGLAGIIDSLKRTGLDGVIENYQNGADAGAPIAAEFGVPDPVLSNFPGSDPDAMDWASLLRHNARLMLAVR